MGSEPRARVVCRFEGSPWWLARLPFGTQALERWLHRHATADPTALTSVDARDSSCGHFWPGEAKQAHFYALVLPRAMQLYGRSAAKRRDQLIGTAIAAALSRKGTSLSNLAAYLFCSWLL